MRRNLNVLLRAVLGGLIAVGSASVAAGQSWQVPAQWHRVLKKAVPGTLVFDDQGAEFRSAKFNQRWEYVEIHSFDLSGQDLTIVSYQNRPWHEPGERRFHFTWTDPILPEIAAQIAERVGKPILNAVPLISVASLAEIPAHHRVWSGGSNGTLRLRDSGVDYVTKDGRDSRTWRWADIRTIANPNPYELRVEAYREVFEFDLKQPLARTVFEQMWDRLYAAELNLSAGGGEHR